MHSKRGSVNSAPPDLGKPRPAAPYHERVRELRQDVVVQVQVVLLFTRKTAVLGEEVNRGVPGPGDALQDCDYHEPAFVEHAHLRKAQDIKKRRDGVADDVEKARDADRQENAPFQPDRKRHHEPAKKHQQVNRDEQVAVRGLVPGEVFRFLVFFYPFLHR